MRKLLKKWVVFLKKQPESGMGYHRCNIRFSDSTIMPFMIFNCEEFECPDSHKKLAVVRIDVLK